MSQRTPEPSLDSTFSALANRDRRELLVTLSECNTLVPIDSSDEDASTQDIEMYHVHLPKLEAAGLIEWNRETNEVRKGARFDEVRPLIDQMSDHAEESSDG